MEFLSADILAGLDRLASDPPPRVRDPDAWAGIVEDARRLADDGWAAKALALGWSARELFGASAAMGEHPDCYGLAVWLAGRKLVLIDAATAMVIEGRGRAIYYRPSNPERLEFLWRLRAVQRQRVREAADGR